MNILCDESNQSFSLKFSQITSDHLDQFIQLIHICRVPFGDIILIRILEISFGYLGPHHAIYDENNLGWEHFNPIGSFHSWLSKF